MTGLKNVQKIVILRANALGDFIFALPALTALRQAYPAAEIVFLGKPWHQEFIPDHVPAVDRVIAVPPTPGVGVSEHAKVSDKEQEAFFTAMQREEFDLALQMHGGGRYSNPFLLRLGAQKTAGLATSDAPQLDITLPYVFYQNDVLRLLEVVAQVGATTHQLSPEVVVTAKDKRAAQKIADTYHAQRYITLHPGATDPRRRWPAQKFAEVAKHFHARGLTVFVTGVASEEAVVKKVVDAADGAAINLCGKIDFTCLVGLLAASSFVISNDTGPLHLAGAVGAKSVGIYWIGNVLTAGHMTRQNHRPLISWATHCPRCKIPCVSSEEVPFGASACQHTLSFVDDVSVQQVIKASNELL